MSVANIRRINRSLKVDGIVSTLAYNISCVDDLMPVRLATVIAKVPEQDINNFI